MIETRSRRSEEPRLDERTSGDVLRGLGAFALLLVVVTGIPVALALVAGAPPLPGDVPGVDGVRDLVTTRDDGTLLVGFLIWVGWIAWATFALSVLVEIPAAVRGRAAAQLPGLRLQQRAAAGLVGLIIAAMAAGPVASGAEMTGTVVSTSPPDAADASSVREPGPGTYVVQPGDTLWEIADRELGDGRRWPEIAKLNYGQPQPNAVHGLQDPNRIDPGWQLAIPFDPPAGDGDEAHETHTVVEGDTLWDIAAAHLDPEATDAEIAAEWPRWYERNREVIGDNPDLILPGMRLQAPEADSEPPSETDDNATSPRPSRDPEPEESIFEPLPETEELVDEPAEPDSDPEDETQGEPDDRSSNPMTVVDASTDSSPDVPDIPLRTIGGIGSLLAAGLIAVLAVHRRRQRSKRVAGQRLEDLDGAASSTERDLWDVADEFGVEAVDLALRAIAASCARDGTKPPIVRAARLTADQFELYLDEPSTLPAPWTQADDDYVWAITPGADLDSGLSAAEVRDTPAPYPGLVTIGHDTEGGHILLDLEHVGVLNIDASELRVRHVMTAIAIELATSSWADDATVAVVGICSELADSLGTGRLRYVDTVDELLNLLESHASNDRTTLSASGAASAMAARSAGVGEWYPEIALIASSLSSDQAARLHTVLHGTPRLAMAAVVTGTEAISDWEITLDPSDQEDAVLEPLGLAVAPQQVNATDYRAVVDMLASVRQPAVGAPNVLDYVQPSDASVDDEPGAGRASRPTQISEPDDVVADLNPRDGPVICVLGPVQIDGTRGTADPSHIGQLTEIAAYIALHPGCAGEDLDHAIWPGEPLKGKTRAQACSRLRNWLGDDDSGARYFPQMVDGVYRFSPAVRTDWDEFQRLVGDQSAIPRLQAALDLVRGQPFSGATGRRPKYRWADNVRASMIETIADTACAVAAHALAGGSPHRARDAATVGLQAEPGMEQLWRLLITAEHDAGNLAAVRDAVSRLHALFDELGTEPEPETAELISRLSPSPMHGRAGVT